MALQDTIRHLTSWCALVSARTAYAVAASRIKRPMSDDGSRCLLSDCAGQLPSVVSWFAESHANARLSLGLLWPSACLEQHKSDHPRRIPVALGHTWAPLPELVGSE